MKLNINANAASSKKDLYAVRVWDRTFKDGCAYVNIRNSANAVFDIVRKAHANPNREDLVVQVWLGTAKSGHEVARYIGGKPAKQAKRMPAYVRPSLEERLARQDALSLPTRIPGRVDEPATLMLDDGGIA